jgi:hypothetical protein
MLGYQLELVNVYRRIARSIEERERRLCHLSVPNEREKSLAGEVIAKLHHEVPEELTDSIWARCAPRPQTHSIEIGI